MKHSDHNHILFRRFSIVVALIMLLGIGLLHLIQSTHRDAGSFTIHNRALEWEKHEKLKANCETNICDLKIDVTSVT